MIAVLSWAIGPFGLRLATAAGLVERPLTRAEHRAMALAHLRAEAELAGQGLGDDERPEKV
jgi:hypothetical protein